jgi:hypothetical protein
MIKTKSASAVAAAFLLSAFSVRAETVRSPDGRFAVETGRGIEVVDSTGQTVLGLVPSLNGANKVEVAWSPDSRRVVIATNAARGSGVMAAWREGAAWHKTVEPDSESGFDRLVRGHGRLVSEHRSLGGWVSADALTVTGALIFANGRREAYRYTLTFGAAPGGLDRGGFQEGALRATNYRSE